MKSRKIRKQGSILVVVTVGIAAAALFVGSILEFSLTNLRLFEKEVGHIKSAQILKLASRVIIPGVSKVRMMITQKRN